MGAYDSEKFCYHCGDAGEVLWPGFTFPSSRERRQRHDRLKALGIHDSGCRFKTDIYPFLSAKCAIFRNGPWVLRQVFGWVELCRVYEDTHDERITS